ncbi:uncharacterized protein [Rutidosis leptorrhynchoides]|uniref:uncharacterized protein n=1 Tax=Rutidosis leptorrhynchoides TaxID=125765 RepID=UPI003A99D640
MWRVQTNRLPVRIELDNKGIDLNSVLCPVCNDDIESINHALVACKSAASLWEKVRLWWGIDNLQITSYSDLALCSSPHIRDNLGSQIWQAVIWVTTYYIWKNRNALVFGNNASSIPCLFSDIQSKSYEWINCRGKNIELEWLTWISNPKSCSFNLKSKDGIG